MKNEVEMKEVEIKSTKVGVQSANNYNSKCKTIAYIGVVLH